MQVTLTGPIEAFIQCQMAQGYNNADEVVRQAFLRWMNEESDTPPHIQARLDEAAQGRFLPGDLSSIHHLAQAIEAAFKELCDDDGALFGLQPASDSDIDRKLHEVCINHKLAEKLAAQACFSESEHGRLYVDIEFNREGARPKILLEDVVRPDIIVHNRQSDHNKLNLLVVECKKELASASAIEDDRKNVMNFIKCEKYAYQYGLCVIYKRHSVCGKLYERRISTAGEPEAVLLQEIKCPRD